jgi:hypothetical protein
VSDIVERLGNIPLYHGWGELSVIPEEARDEIVRLRAEVEEARANSMSNWGQRERAEAAEAERDRLREALTLYREAVVIDVKMEGPRFMGANSSALKRAWDHDRAALGDKP